MTHDELMQWLAQTSLSHSIINQISTAVKERDELRASARDYADKAAAYIAHLEQRVNDMAKIATVWELENAKLKRDVDMWMRLEQSKNDKYNQSVDDHMKLLEIIDEKDTENAELRALLSRISAEATRTPIVGGHVYEIDGGLMGLIDAVLTTKTLL